MDVFVSYSGKDIEFIIKMCSILREHGISYWAEYENEESGDNSAAKTVSRISEAKVLLVFVSKNANESKRVMNELNCASMCNKPILPVVIDDVELSPVFEYYMGSANRINYSQSKDFVEKFVDMIRSMIDSSNTLPADKKAEHTVTKQNSLKNKKKKNKVIISAVVSFLSIAAITLLVLLVIIPSNKYKVAVELEESGKKIEAAMAFGEITSFKDSRERSFALWDDIAQRQTVAAGESHTVVLKSNGTVVAVGNNEDGQCNVSEWTDIIAVAAGDRHTVGLKADGTVVAVGDRNWSAVFDLTDWKDIVAISVRGYNTVGLKSDGTVISQSEIAGLSDWTDIVDVSSVQNHTVGLKADGTVVATGFNDYGQCNVNDWTDIVDVSVGWSHTVGLKADGTVVAVGENDCGQCNVSDWTDIVAVSAHDFHTVGLKRDGTVVATNYIDDYFTSGTTDYRGQCDVNDWTDIVDVSAGWHHTVGIKSDGTVVATEYIDDPDYGYYNHQGQCDVDRLNS